jgi:hypothetical protein
VQKTALLAILTLFGAGTVSAQYDDSPPVPIRFHLSFGPTTATSSGRTIKLPIPSQCFSCPKTEEVVSGADRGAYHMAIGASGVPGHVGLALRMELMFNRTTSDPYVAPPPTCKSLQCTQPRKAEEDKAYMVVGGLDFAPLDRKVVSPYVTIDGGLQLNRLKWRQDSSTTSELSGKGLAFGPFVAVGAGVRAAVRQWAAFIEWRRFATFQTPGSQMSPLSVGVQYRAKRFGVGA